MKKEFVSYEQALALKELGFNEPCLAYYTVIPEDKIDWFTIPEQGITDKTSFGSSKNYNSKSFEEEGTISAPTFSQAFRFFREKHGFFCSPTESDDNITKKYDWHITKNLGDGKFYIHFIGYKDTYEEAELTCLIKLIEIVKQR